jgi:hypothetical protein
MRLIDVPTLRKANLRSGIARMSVRQVNHALWISAAACCGIAVLVVLLGVLVPINSSATDAPELKRSSRTSRAGSQALLPPLESFDSIWAKPLRRPLIDPPVVAQPGPAPGVPSSDGLQVTLVGTVGNSLAMLRAADGSISLKGIGDQISGAEVIAIRPGQIDVRSGGQTLTLSKPRDPDPQTGIVTTPPNP